MDTVEIQIPTITPELNAAHEMCAEMLLLLMEAEEES